MNKLDSLIEYLLSEQEDLADIEIPENEQDKFRLYISLVNIRPAVKADESFLLAEDEYLSELSQSRGITNIADLAPIEDGVYTSDYSAELERLKNEIQTADAIVIGAGAGLSTAEGFTYSGERFYKYFSDFAERFGITDMYSGGFYPFPDDETFWAWWSRHIYCNRYMDADNGTYKALFELVKDKNYFVITTNVDHQFQRAGFDKERLFYTQGDYGLFQCSVPCHDKTYDNKELVLDMIEFQNDMKIPTGLIPKCPVCGEPMTMNLRSDDTFVEDEGWHEAARRYRHFLNACKGKHVLYLELGVGGNTPGIIKL